MYIIYGPLQWQIIFLSLLSDIYQIFLLLGLQTVLQTLMQSCRLFCTKCQQKYPSTVVWFECIYNRLLSVFCVWGYQLAKNDHGISTEPRSIPMAVVSTFCNNFIFLVLTSSIFLGAILCYHLIPPMWKPE